jgi:hypothetical protein
MEETCYRGGNFAISRSDGTEVQAGIGRASHTVKPCYMPAVTHLLAPGQSITVAYHAYVTPARELLFEQHTGRTGTGFYPGAKDTDALPRRYIGCGRSFPLAKAGNYSIYALYHGGGGGTAPWIMGDGSSYRDLWSGEARSNTINIVVD